MRLKSVVVISFVVSLVVNATLSFVVPHASILLLEEQALHGQFIRQLAEIGANEAQIKLATQRFNQSLQTVLDKMSRRKNAVILKKKEALSGGVDVTDEVRIQLSHSMRASS